MWPTYTKIGALGRPVFYEGRYGWKVRFPDSQIHNFEANPGGMIKAPHVLIAQYQIRLLQKGTVPENPHPFVPPSFSRWNRD